MRVRVSLALGALAAGLLASRVALRNAGTTCGERRCPLPGDEMVAGASGCSTMAATVGAPPAAVWPWLVQMGGDRAGFYSWDRLDNGGRPSATEIRPEWQGLAVGDRVAADRSGRAWFEVAALEHGRVLVLRATLDFARMRSIDRS